MKNFTLVEVAMGMAMPEDGLRRHDWPRDHRVVVDPATQHLLLITSTTKAIWLPTLEDLVADNYEYFGNNYAKI